MERGAASPILLAVAVLAALLGAGLVGAGQLLGAALQAAGAADAAALAAAPVTFRPFGTTRTPSQEAAWFAEANGASLVSCRCPVDETWEPRTVEVVVQITVDVLGLGEQTLRAASRADFDPTRLLVEPGGD